LISQSRGLGDVYKRQVRAARKVFLDSSALGGGSGISCPSTLGEVMVGTDMASHISLRKSTNLPNRFFIPQG
jgi:hypothetical protein